MDTNIDGLRHLLDYARARQCVAEPVQGVPLLLEQRDLRRPAPRQHPHARGLPRERLLHRSPRLLRRVEAVRRDAVRQLRAAARAPGDHRPPVQQLRSRAQDHRPAGDPRLRPGRARRAGHRHALGRVAPADLLLRGRRRRRLLQGARPRAAPASPTTSASSGPRSPCCELAERITGLAPRAVRLPRHGWSARRARERGLPGGQPQPAAARSSPRRGPSWATIPRSSWTRGCADRWSGTPTIATRRRRDASLRSSAPATSAW